MHSRYKAALALGCLLLSAAALPPAAAEPPCTGDSCAVGGTYVNATVDINITWNSLRGNITVMLYEEGAPITCANFIKLTAEKFYDGIMFHRCIDGFVAQTGDPNSKDNNPYNDGQGGSGTTIPLEINETLTHIDGALGMARSTDPNSASSQFYICDGPQHGLDGNYSVFGVVVAGLDLAKQIAACPTYGNKRPLLKDHPIDDIVMSTLTYTAGYHVNATNSTSGKTVVRSFFTQNVVFALGAGGAAIGAALIIVGVVRMRRQRRLQAETAKPAG
jgi:cyclophilin family peptidyl-prolyl cis-trans isomerase